MVVDTCGSHDGEEKSSDDDDFSAHLVCQDRQEDQTHDRPHELGRHYGVPDIQVIAVETCVVGDGVDLFELAGIEDGAGVYLLDVGGVSAGEGGGDEEVGGQEDGEGDE